MPTTGFLYWAANFFKKCLSPEEGQIPRGSETILVVEDDAPLRELTVSMLQDAGYRVLEASNAEHALEIIKTLSL